MIATLCSVTVLAFARWPWPSILSENGYAMPPFDGRVLVPFVSGTTVGGEVGSSETIMPGVWTALII